LSREQFSSSAPFSLQDSPSDATVAAEAVGITTTAAAETHSSFTTAVDPE